MFIYIRGEYEREFEVLRDSLEAMRKADLLGGVTVVLHRGAGAYICGEETALLESLEGRRGQPRTKPPFPAIAGLYAAPTAVNNVESITTVTSVFELGAAEYAKLGVENSTGTRVFSLSGDVVNPRQLRAAARHHAARADLRRRRRRPERPRAEGDHPRRLVDLGPHRRPRSTRRSTSRSLVEAGSSIGSAGVIVIDDRCCMVQLGIRVSQFYEHESCGKCTPCRVGTRWLTQILQKIEDGRRAQPDLDLLLSVCDRIIGKCLCPLGDSDAIAVLELRRPLPRRVPGAHRPRALPLRRRLVARGDPRALGDARAATATRPRMSELFTVTVDDRQVEVPKGTGLVEAALAAGIEIPVFCYEPRLGPPVGACRMCLVEIEGMPKLQAGCTLTVTDGMVIRTAATSAKAAEGQEATLEFILVNHPLDCPVCDKGGECPLQDLAFRYGPGNTRMSFPKLTFDKPIPVSPLIALDRERCILCYRCTRFSEDVSEDGQLIAREPRRPHRDRDLRGRAVPLAVLGQRDRALPGRRAHVDALPLRGAAVGHPERADRLHRVPRRLQRLGDDPRGEGEADPLAQPPRGRPRLALRQGPLHVPAPSRRGPHHRHRCAAGPKGLEEIAWDEALDHAEEMLREAPTARS